MPSYEIRFIPGQGAAVVSVSTTPANIGESMGTALAQAFQAVADSGAVPAGPPFARYFSFGETIEYEAGLPLTAPFKAGAEVRASHIGGGEAAVAMHVGPYDTIEQTYVALTAWLEDQGRTPAGPMWESYLTSPDEEPDPAKWLTEVHVPVEAVPS